LKRILVALDASERARLVLDYAAELARKTGARLVLFRAVSVPVELPAQAFSRTPNELVPELLNDAAESLRRLSAHLPSELVERVESDVGGSAWQAVCDAAAEMNADLVVVGSHGHGTFDRLLGTTASRIVNHAECPVLVVRNPEKHPV
jgi:nucleotide-binding universal stress UspA family protein